jgi:hypothetical protein
MLQPALFAPCFAWMYMLFYLVGAAAAIKFQFLFYSFQGSKFDTFQGTIFCVFEFETCQGSAFDTFHGTLKYQF